jgi:hypothetical protein
MKNHVKKKKRLPVDDKENMAAAKETAEKLA